MTLVKRLSWLLITLALAAIALLGLARALTPAAAAPIPNPTTLRFGDYSTQSPISNIQPPALWASNPQHTIISETWVAEPISGVLLYTRVLQPDPALYPGQQFPAVVFVPGGLGDGAPTVDRPEYQGLAAKGFIVVAFNPPGRGTGQPGNLASGGVEDCNGFAGQNALKAIIEYTAALPNVDSDNIGVQTGSYGITMGAGALGRYPSLPVKYLVDMEGPSNNLISTFYYSPGGERNHLCGHWSVISDTSQANADWWIERESYRYIGDFQGYYLRAQAEFDHAQPTGVYTHTLEMNNTAVISGLPWVRINGLEMGNPISATYTVTQPLWLPGRLDDYPNLATNYIAAMARSFGAAVTPTWRTTLNLPHDVDRLDNGHTLITAGDLQQSKLLEVDAEGNVVALYIGELSFAHNADRLSDDHTLLSDTGADRVIELDEENRTVWSSDWITLNDGSVLDYPNDANWLPGDHLLITDRNNHRVIEIDRSGAVVWQYPPYSHTLTLLNGPHNADRLDNGNTIIADSNNNRIVEVSPAGAIVWQYPPTCLAHSHTPLLPHSHTSSPLDWPRDADRLPNGNTLITDSNNDRIVEVTPGGVVVWEYATGLSHPYDADRLDNGATLISDSGNGRVIEVDNTGDIVWQYPPAAPQIDPPILVSIVTHNEEPLSGAYPDFVNDEPAFWQHRNALVQFVDMLYANGVMFNYQSDWNFLRAVALYDTGTPGTNGKNVVRYIKEDLGFEVDPHAHETQYNYADVAYLIEALGVTPSHTVGGFRAEPPEDSKLEYLWQPITGAQYPTYTWQAEILWGGATLFHQNEESLWVSGVWKPQDKHHFLEHAAAAPLPYVGGYGRKCDPLIQKQQDGELEEDKIHTCTMFVGQNNLLLPGYIQSFEQQIQALDAAGNVRWMGLAEVINLWETEYGSEPNILPFLTPVAQGTIAGIVRDAGGGPIAGAQVRIYGAETYSDTTDAAGDYALYNVPVAAPRYILVASAGGYQTGQQGDVDAADGLTTTVNFTLTAGSSTSDTLEVRLGYLIHRELGPLLTPLPGALISPTLYPTEVLPYLEPGQYIESDDPDIAALAQSILDAVPPHLRTDSTYIAHQVYVWMVQNIEYDLVSNYPGDVTGGNWQTTYGGWGHSFADWAYTAREVLEEGRSICIENERLTTALLRALDIPARPAPQVAHPVTQWWVQLPGGSGFWANMDTALGRTAYVKNGDLWAFFPAAEEHTVGFWSPDADAPIHVDWWTDEPALWWEHYGGRRYYTDTAAGLAQAQTDLATFADTGVVTPGGIIPDQPHYWLYSRGFGVDLTNVPLQSSFVVSFALPTEAITYTQLLSITHWTNHPEWVVDTYTTTLRQPFDGAQDKAQGNAQSSAETGESLTWYVLEMWRRRIYLPLVLR